MIEKIEGWLKNKVGKGYTSDNKNWFTVERVSVKEIVPRNFYVVIQIKWQNPSNLPNYIDKPLSEKEIEGFIEWFDTTYKGVSINESNNRS